MKKLHIGTWARMVSAKLTRKKRSTTVAEIKAELAEDAKKATIPKSKEESDERLKEMMAKVRTMARSIEEPDSRTAKRTAILEMILPKVINLAEGSDFVANDEAKEWAFACGEILGMLAALSITTEFMEGAIEEVSRDAKDYARQVDRSIAGITKHKKPSSTPEDATPSLNDATSAQTLHMIADLRAQARLESDKAVAAAMRSMADKMERELKEGKKVDAA